MPTIYASTHNDILKNFLETSEFVISNQDRQIPGKHKNGYIFNF